MYYHLPILNYVFSGLIEFGLTDEMSVRAFYHHFYLLLEDEKLVMCVFTLCTLCRYYKPSD